MIKNEFIKRILPDAILLTVAAVAVSYPWQVLADDKPSTPKAAHAKVAGSGMGSSQSISPAESRVKELTYGESNVYTIRTKYGYQTNIVFDPKEDIQTISVGDRSLWQIIPAGNRLFIRPMVENISTNMTLLTNKHSYEFDLKSVSENNESNIYVARFIYPLESSGMVASDNAITPQNTPLPNTVNSAEIIPVEDTSDKNKSHLLKVPQSASSSEKIRVSVDTPFTQTNSSASINYNYTYAGPDSLAPLQVYDNGKVTFIKYHTISNAVPDVLTVNADGKESPASATVKENLLIVDSVAGELALRSRNGEIRIYNESLNPR